MSHSIQQPAPRAVHLKRWTNLSLALSLGLSATACGGGGEDGPGGEPFTLQQIGSPSGELSNGATWSINRPIEFVFSEAVDFSTVNANSINILTQQGGVGALGEFRSKTNALGEPIEEIVVWQPRCPLKPDLSDAGLTPGGVDYRILVNGQDASSSLSVRSKSGKVLQISQNRAFETPTSLAPADLYFDPVGGAPGVLVQNAAGTNSVFSFLETLEDDGMGALIPTETPFTINELGNAVMIPDVPINLFSAADQRLSVVLEFNQPVNPSAENISSNRLRLQFLNEVSNTWVDIQSLVQLEANCTTTGGRVRITPVSILPQQSSLRVEVDSSFQDLIGQVNTLSLNSFSELQTISLTNDVFTPAGNLGDEIFEPFLVGAPSAGSFEQPTPEFAEPAAIWEGGSLRPNFNFLGTGGPLGTFDWVVRTSTTTIFNTTAQPILGGPGGEPNSQVTFVDGLVNVRNMTIEPGGTLIVVGPNPMRIFATGEVRIQGNLLVVGTNAPDVVQLATPTIPKSGGPGNAGGGRGGLGTPSTTQSSAVGGNGFGPFNLVGAGGRGGESSFGDKQPEKQRPGGGGGGSFAQRHALPAGNDDALLVTDFLDDVGPGIVGPTGDPGQQNLAPVRGSDGINNSTSAVSGSPVSLGGEVGPFRFNNSENNDDFFGVRIVGENDEILRGELLQPSAGSGGGGGGDAIRSAEFPQVPWNKQAWKREWSGSGGGGGGGQLQIFAIGSIIFEGAGKINARGGAGGRGESISGGINNTAGGGGGGSGGHVILQSATTIDFSTSTEGVPSGSQGNNYDINRGILAINALGGDGGPGGDFNPTGSGDQYNQGGYRNSLIFEGAPGQSPESKPNAGGAGGAGVVQLHVPAPIEDNLIPPTGFPSVNQVIRPVPYLLEPSFGAVSKARTIAIPLSGALDNPNSVLEQVLFNFAGTDSAAMIQDPDEPGDPDAMIVNPDAGEVLRNVGQVADLPALLSGSTIALDAVDRIVRIDASSLLTDVSSPISNDIYLRNPALLREFALDLTTGGLTARYDVASASFDVDAEELVLALGANDQPLSAFSTGDNFELLPRFFRVRTNGTVDVLPSTAAIRFRFQGLAADFNGNPIVDEPLVDWTPDALDLNSDELAATVSFVRIEATFDIADGDTELSNLNARPVLDFFRLPFMF